MKLECCNKYKKNNTDHKIHEIYILQTIKVQI